MLVYECLMIMLMLCKSSYARLTPEVLHVSRWRKDQWVVHEEIPEVKETMKVERVAKRLVTEVQVCFA